jgi:hypothetical protein
LPDEADESPDGNADRRDDQDDDGQAVRPGHADAETRNREEYYTDLRVAVSKEESTTVQRITAEEKAAGYPLIRLVGVTWSGGAGVTAEVTREVAAERSLDRQSLAVGDHCTS